MSCCDLVIQYLTQWRNRRGGGGRGAQCPPRDFWPGNFCWLIWKKIGKEKRVKIEKKRRKIVKGRWKGEKLEMEAGKVLKRGEALFFFFFFFFSLLKTTEICFGSTKMGIFYREKAFHAGKKNQEKLLCPLRKICLLSPWSHHRNV